MAGLNYSLDDLETPDKSISVDRAFRSVKASEVESITDYCTATSVKLTGDLIGDLSLEKTDKNRTNKFFMNTKQLDMCIAQAENLQDMLHSEMMAMKVLGILSFGLRKSGELLADAIYEHKMSKVELKRVQAAASLEKFYDYIKERKEDTDIDLKATDKTKESYINIDSDVIKAAEKEALCEAMVSQLDTYKTQFTMAMSGVKAMISKQRGDSLISGVATPTAMESSNGDSIL